MDKQPPPTDMIVLVEQAREGDPCAMETLLEQLYRPLWRYVNRKLSDRRDATDLTDDVLQEVMLRIFRALPHCRAGSSGQVHQWSLQIARHVLVDRLRCERARQRRVEVVPDLENCAAAASFAHWERQQSSRRQRADRMLRRSVRSVLRTVPESTLRLLRLRVQLGDGWGLIGQELQTSTAAAKRRFQRAQVLLRRRFSAAWNTLPPDEQALLCVRLTRLGARIRRASE